MPRESRRSRAVPTRRALRIRNPKSKTQNRPTRSALFAWFVVIVGLLSAAALALYGFLHGGYGRDTHAEWLKLSDELKKKGEPLYLADIKPAEIPDEQNFFAADVFAGVTADAARSPLLQRAADPGNGLSVADLLAQATKGGGASLEAIAATMQSAGLVRKQTDFLLAGDRVRAGMRSLGLDFTPLAAAADRPAARFPLDYAQPFPQLPHLRFLEALGDWLAIRAIAQLSTGDAEEAATDILLIGRLADSLAGEPFLPSQRTRRLLLGLLAGCVRVGIGWDAWSDEQLARFAESLDKARLITDLAWAIRGERAQVNSAINLALSGRRPGASEPLQAWLGPDLVGLDMRGLRARQVGINRSVQDLLESLGQPDGLTPPAAPAAAPADAPPPSTRERLEALEADARVAAQLQTYLAQAQTACALERYRRANSAYPEKLDALVPGFLSALPPDPITAQPLVYERRPAGYTLTGKGWSDGQPWTWTR